MTLLVQENDDGSEVFRIFVIENLINHLTFQVLCITWIRQSTNKQSNDE